jgi:hypothetical protein
MSPATRKCRILGQDFKVRWMAGSTFLKVNKAFIEKYDLSPAGLLGRCDVNLNRIDIRLDVDGEPLPDDRLREILWHEIKHGLLDQIGLPVQVEEEDLVRSLSAAECCVFRDNRWLIPHLFGGTLS